MFSIFSRMLNHIVADYYYLFNFKLNLQISKDKVTYFRFSKCGQRYVWVVMGSKE